MVMCDSFGLSVIDHECAFARIRDRARYRGFGSAGKEDYNLKILPGTLMSKSLSGTLAFIEDTRHAKGWGLR